MILNLNWLLKATAGLEDHRYWLVKLCTDDEIVYSNLGGVLLPVFQLYQELLRLKLQHYIDDIQSLRLKPWSELYCSSISVLSSDPKQREKNLISINFHFSHLFWVSKSVFIFIPAFQEVVGVLAKVSSPLQYSPASAQGLHVAPDGDVLPGHEDRVEAALGDGLLFHQIWARRRWPENDDKISNLQFSSLKFLLGRLWWTGTRREWQTSHFQI